MEEGEIVLHFLVPANQDPPKAIHPTMRTFHDPSSGSAPRLVFERPRFFTACPNVGRKTKLLERVPYFRIVIPFVQTHPLGPFLGGARPLDDHAIHGVFDQLHIGPIGPGHDQAHGHPVSLGQQTALDPPFGPVCGIGPGFFPLPAEPCSSRHPCSANSSRSPSDPRTVPPPPATTSETPPPPPRPGTDHGPWNGDTSPWHLRLPTDSPCARHKRWRRHTADPRPGGDRHQNDGGSDALALPPPVPPRVRPRPDSWPSLGSRLPGGVSVSWLLECSSVSTYHRLVIRIAT